MKQKLKYLMLLVLVLLLCTGLQSVHTMAAETDGASEEEDATGLSLYNIHWQNYDTSSSPVYSTLVKTDTGYMSVTLMRNSVEPYYVNSFINGKILVQYYNDSFDPQAQRIIPTELSYYGGFYAGEDYYYLVFGQTNPDEDDSTEVIRVVKYDKNWNRLDSASLYGANTYTPFRMGSLRMDEYGGYLYIRTSHTIYDYGDGKHHQSTMMFQVRESDMVITEALYKVLNEAAGIT